MTKKYTIRELRQAEHLTYSQVLDHYNSYIKPSRKKQRRRKK